jgi:hypothetical protein
MLPPCASTIFLEMNNPIPVPPEEFVTNLEKGFRAYSWASILDNYTSLAIFLFCLDRDGSTSFLGSELNCIT